MRRLKKKSLRSQIGMVLQDTLLFSTTIRENIAYGKPGATEAEIIEAARKALALDFISKMPQDFDSPVGERGGHLSVGFSKKRAGEKKEVCVMSQTGRQRPAGLFFR